MKQYDIRATKQRRNHTNRNQKNGNIVSKYHKQLQEKPQMNMAKEKSNKQNEETHKRKVHMWK